MPSSTDPAKDLKSLNDKAPSSDRNRVRDPNRSVCEESVQTQSLPSKPSFSFSSLDSVVIPVSAPIQNTQNQPAEDISSPDAVRVRSQLAESILEPASTTLHGSNYTYQS